MNIPEQYPQHGELGAQHHGGAGAEPQPSGGAGADHAPGAVGEARLGQAQRRHGE